MKKLLILGPGCPKCQQLARNTEEAAKALGMDYELEKITDIMEISKFGVLMTPGLVVDNQIKSSGKALDVNQIKELLA
jgi:small redox-active disulfide protein 2